MASQGDFRSSKALLTNQELRLKQQYQQIVDGLLLGFPKLYGFDENNNSLGKICKVSAMVVMGSQLYLRHTQELLNIEKYLLLISTGIVNSRTEFVFFVLCTFYSAKTQHFYKMLPSQH